MFEVTQIRQAIVFACFFSLVNTAYSNQTLPDILVIGGGADSSTSPSQNASKGHASEFSRKDIENIASQDGSLNKLYQQVPGLQFSEEALDADKMGELRPESISISGGKAYENLFNLDGFSISSNLDPANKNHSAVNDVSGHDQGLFIDSELIEKIEVHRSNVPARFSGFTGGVVDLETRQPDSEKIKGSVFYGITQSDWVSYRIFVAEPDDDDVDPTDPPVSPIFKRQRMGGTVNIPFSEKVGGLILSGTRSSSTTSDISFNQSKAQIQNSENLLLKLAYPLSDQMESSLSLAVSPFSHQLFIKDVKDSDYTLEGGGFSLQTSIKYFGENWDQRVRLGYSHQKNVRQAPKDFFNWANTIDRNWGRDSGLASSRKGGFGDLEKYSNQTSLKWQANRYDDLSDLIKLDAELGLDLTYQVAGFDRKETTYIYQNAVINSQIQCLGHSDCVQGQQYFTQRQVYQQQSVEVSLPSLGAYVELTPSYERYSSRIGIRYDRDAFLNQNNIAPRLTATVDIFNNNKSIINFGANRYYSNSLLTYKLREASAPHYMEYRGAQTNIVRDWLEDVGAGRNRYRFSDAVTPYSDELALGFSQQLVFDDVNLGKLSINATQRKGKKEFSRVRTEQEEDGYRYFEMRNEGFSDYWGVSIDWRLNLNSTTFSLNATTSRTKTTNENYDSASDAEGDYDWVLFDDKRVRRGELDILREDFARNWVINAAVSHRFNEYLQAAASLRYLGATPRIYNTNRTRRTGLITLPSGEVIPEVLEVYTQDTRQAVTQVDLKSSFSIPLGYKQKIQVDLEARNAFGQRTYRVPPKQSGIELGRSWWVMLRYNWSQ
ncbi:TonB-dependent receptor plug domain-containing protein [Thiomicrospira sp. R3]|uniref:TonB-dependent receptor plug domain-containing protein n=1 Tax=Thiomicrospira sp. R3 TaxID=3035472 RepID=UPI00259B6A04|nr:TonB-dependent receptor plug domain-containing protein [Thiomicrospira sp. R3]WFE69445.1 TonB-dependent receptor plug domain-containing protein [Thiomicrospira sp. R3]